MRTTLDIDDALLRGAQALFPPGTPKTAIIEEALRLLAASARPARSPRLAHHDDPRWAQLIAEGRLTPATASGPPPKGPGAGVPLAQLLRDIADDRNDR